MGYYDNDDFNRPVKQKGNRGGAFIAGLIGAILGALLLLFTIPALSDFGVLPDVSLAPQEETESEINQGTVTKDISIDVTNDITAAVENVGEAVVGVINLQKTDFWAEDYGEAGAGSGVIYKKEGGEAFIVTNNHVVEGAGQIEVSLNAETRVSAELVGTDPLMDLAVLRIPSEAVTKIAEFGDSDTLKPGEPAIAIGNPLGFLEGTVTQGIISNPERSFPVDTDQNGTIDWNADVIQTDASINPGNSGGALINISGQLVGINSMKIAQSSVEGIGFSIPINIAAPIISDLENYGEVRRPQIGIGTKSLSEIPTYHWSESLKLPDDIDHGVVVMSVFPTSSGDQAGLKELDVITAMDGQEIKNSIELRKFLYTKKEIGDKVKLTIYRAGAKQEIDLTLSEQQSS
ncbi:trypsin-like peptidase domain-containing protein [Pseudalkalibacillus hwajinpoensis]|uniref:S1C family serine protease n=1 Tax=Guptibacillus hwajinpoensis TaxID=208199 RepID=UPI00325B90B7